MHISTSASSRRGLLRYADIEVLLFKDLTHSTALLVVKALLEQLNIAKSMNKSFGAKFPSFYFSDWINERANFEIL